MYMLEPFCYNATVVRIVDGDTLRLNIDLGFHTILKNQSVRLTGVDAPETRSKDPKTKAAGLAAEKALSGFVEEGSKVVVRTLLDDEGKYGRILGTIFIENGTNINKFLIDNNYAVEYSGQSREERAVLHEKNYEILLERGEV